MSDFRLKMSDFAGPHFNATSQLLGNYRGAVCEASPGNPNPGGDTAAEPCMQSLLQAISKANVGGTTTGMGVLYGVDNKNTSNFTQAIALAQSADIVIMALGLSSGNEPDDAIPASNWGGGGGEGEGTDRSGSYQTLGLPGAQEELFDAIAATGKPVAVVLINGGQVAVDSIAASNAYC